MWHHRTISAYQPASERIEWLLLKDFGSHHRTYMYWSAGKTIDCYLSKRFIIDIIVCTYRFVSMFAFFSIRLRIRCGDWNVDIPKKVIFLCTRLEILSASRWTRTPFFDQRSILSANHQPKKRTEDLLIVNASCIAWTHHSIQHTIDGLKTSGRMRCSSWSIVLFWKWTDG